MADLGTCLGLARPEFSEDNMYSWQTADIPLRNPAGKRVRAVWSSAAAASVCCGGYHHLEPTRIFRAIRWETTRYAMWSATLVELVGKVYHCNKQLGQGYMQKISPEGLGLHYSNQKPLWICEVQSMNWDRMSSNSVMCTGNLILNSELSSMGRTPSRVPPWGTWGYRFTVAPPPRSLFAKNTPSVCCCTRQFWASQRVALVCLDKCYETEDIADTWTLPFHRVGFPGC